MGIRTFIFLFLISVCAPALVAQDNIPPDMILEDSTDLEILKKDELMEDAPLEKEDGSITWGKVDEVDDLDAIKEDLGDIEFIVDEKKEKQVLDAAEPVKSDDAGPKVIPVDAMAKGEEAFDIGKEEMELLKIAEKMQGQIPDKEWNEITTHGQVASYTVVSGDWLWKISKRLFGSGFYYSKIWSLNPYITNPHEIEPGMILTFTTGHQDALPEFSIGGLNKFAVKEKAKKHYEKFGDDAVPDWMSEREKIKRDGKYIQFTSPDTDKELKELSESQLTKEYDSYQPPQPEFVFQGSAKEYDDTGFGYENREIINFKQGFYLTTFVTTNLVQDYGKIDSAIDEKKHFVQYDKVYVRFDENINVIAGDKFSVYASEGEVSHINSDRKGSKYSINGSLIAIQKHSDVWECDIVESVGLLKRNDRITVYTPKIGSIVRSFNERLIEAIIIGSYDKNVKSLSLGDVIYLDRGRVDGVEQGNVFEVYGFKDRETKRNITDNPTYKNGEVTVLTVTDNFATVLVTNSVRDFNVGDIVITKTKDAAARASMLANRLSDSKIKTEGLDELDAELSMDNLSEDLLKKADRVEFTDDELAELERREREKSILSEQEQDLKALERLEKEIDSAESMMKEARLDEDRLLEDESLDSLERKLLFQEQESLEEIEENVGKRYLDENLNDKDNPYGLTEFDIEEIDELLNIEKQEKLEAASKDSNETGDDATIKNDKAEEIDLLQ